MAESGRSGEQAIRQRAYFIWIEDGCPDGRAEDHWARAVVEHDEPDEEKVLDGRTDANMPALLTQDVKGG